MRFKTNVPVFFILAFTFFSCEARQGESEKKVKVGAEVLLDAHIPELEDKRVGLLMNPTSQVNGAHMLDTLLALGVNVTSLFAAEHGFRGQAGAGEVIEDGVDRATGLPVYSLYGSTKKPTPKMLEEVDIILFDLPDMGVRFYTYSTTLGLVLEAISENNKELWILDRPNPLGGEYVAGWVLRDEYRSFVGAYPLPIAYGLTIGEIANMAVGEEWLNLETNPNYRIIKNEGWKRDMLWIDTGLEWIPPSPNLPGFEHTFAYPGTVIFEGTNISEGRGTPDPFLLIGSPNTKFTQQDLKHLVDKHNVRLDSVTFTPRSISGKALHPKHQDKLCTGIRISYDGNYAQTNPIELGLDLLSFFQTHTEDFEIIPFANNLSGIDLKTIIEEKEPIPGWSEEVEEFRQKRKKYFLYE